MEGRYAPDSGCVRAAFHRGPCSIRPGSGDTAGSPNQAPPDPNVPIYFEVASVKPNKSRDLPRIAREPGGRVVVTNSPLRQLIIYAYDVNPTALVGGPAWIGTSRYDVLAKLEGDHMPVPLGAGPDHAQLAMRTLLADRFKLQVHRETRELDVYALVVAKADGTLGRSLKKSTQDCSPEARARRGRGEPSPAPAGGGPTCGMFNSSGRMMVGGMPISIVMGLLGNLTGRNVVDRTGLTGLWDFEMTYSREAPRNQPPPGSPNIPPAEPDAPSIFTALQEQLGLKLEPTKAPIEVLVIDSVSEPAPD